MTVSDAASDNVVELVPEAPDEPERNFDEDMRLVEALVFASGSAVSEKAMADRLGEGADIPGILDRLKALYAGRGVELTRTNNRWFFRTAPDLGDRLKLEKMVPRKLSRAATETLAIIAYHQPVTRAEIEEIRGVVISKGTLDLLLEEGWIKPKGRRQTPGRPVTWGTSDAFLDHFGLEALSDLPGIDELKAAGLLDSRQGLAAYNARAKDGDTLLFDTDESDEMLEPLTDGDDVAAAGEETADAGEAEASVLDVAPEDVSTDANAEDRGAKESEPDDEIPHAPEGAAPDVQEAVQDASGPAEAESPEPEKAD